MNKTQAQEIKDRIYNDALNTFMNTMGFSAEDWIPVKNKKEYQEAQTTLENN